MKRRQINKKLLKNIEKIYEETKNRVKVGNKLTDLFWTERGLRQGCPLSPLLFIVFIANIEKYLCRRQNGGGIIGRMKVFTLAYADDLAMIAESEEEMKKMLISLGRFFKEKGLQLNADK